tara:strand:+ start:437 stop:598 length:162 start_codon:yes stop_codon:yes gene_type:complete
MTEPKYPSPEEFIEQWEGMQEEFIREGTEFRLDIPDLETTRKWHNYYNKPTQR